MGGMETCHGKEIVHSEMNGLSTLVAVFFSIISLSALASEKVNYIENPTTRRLQGQVALAPLSDITTFDPARTVDSMSQFWLGHVFEGLTTKDARGAIVPALAKDWTVSKDGTVVTFHLRPGLTWEDGVPLKASDFVYAWKRFADPAYASEYAFILRTARVKNAAAVLDRKLPPESLGVSAPDATTLRVELDSPSALLLDLVSLNVFFPVRRDAVEKWGTKFGMDAASVVGNGPFRLSSWTQDGPVALEKSQLYWNAASIGPASIVLPYSSGNAVTAYQSFVTGKIDIDTSLDTDTFSLASKEGRAVDSSPAGALWYLLFNQRDGALFADAALRARVADSLDRREYITKIHGLPGAKPAFGLVPDYILGSTLSRTFRAEFPLETSNRANEKTMMKSKPISGKDEKVLRFIGVGSESNKTEAEYFQRMLERATGRKVTLDLPPFRGRTERIRTGDFDIAMASWIPDYDDALTFLEVFESGAEPNGTGYANAAFDTIIEKARKMPRGSERSGLLARAEQMLLKDNVVVPYRQSVRLSLVARGLEGVKRRALGVDPDLRRARWNAKPPAAERAVTSPNLPARASSRTPAAP